MVLAEEAVVLAEEEAALIVEVLLDQDRQIDPQETDLGIETSIETSIEMSMSIIVTTVGMAVDMVTMVDVRF